MIRVAMIVDDQPEDARILKHVLENFGFQVITKTTVAEANEALLLHMPHLLIVDINLNDNVDGLEWVAGKHADGFSKIPTVIMSAQNDKNTVSRAISLGIRDFILKPLEIEETRRKIFRIVQKLDKENLYQLSTFSQESAKLSVPAYVTGISEVGLAISSFIKNAKPEDVMISKIAIFEEIGLQTPPRLTFLNNQHESRSRLLGVPYRIYSQIKGWSNVDRKKIRNWLKFKNLQRSL